MIFSRHGKVTTRRRRASLGDSSGAVATRGFLIAATLLVTALFPSCDSSLIATARRGGISSTQSNLRYRTISTAFHPIHTLSCRCTSTTLSSRKASSTSASSADGYLAAAAQDENSAVPVTAINFTETSTASAVTTASSTQQGAPAEATATGVDVVFKELDVDGSGAVDLKEFQEYLSRAGYSPQGIEASFREMDRDGNGVISRAEFERAILENVYTADDDCPRGYFLNSVQQACVPLGPIGRVSQRLETLGPFQRVYKRISNLFGVDTKEISKLGVSFALSYSILSNLNGAISLSVAWYISCKRTGLSPLVPGQWRNLLSSYAMIYGLIQILKPFRVAMAIAGSKLSAEWLEMTQTKLNCSRTVAIACQYLTGQVVMAICALIGVSFVSLVTGVPIFGGAVGAVVVGPSPS